MEPKKFKVASVIAEPVLFNLKETVDKCCDFIDKAANEDAKLIVFPETFLPMYPWWIWMSISSVKRLELFKKFFYESVDVEGELFQKICNKARDRNIFVVIGISERKGMTLYNSQVFIDNKGIILKTRRKLVPTGEERTIWGRGDGSDLSVLDTELGKMSGLICYENSMALSRFALYSQGEQLHIANWPGSNFKSQPRDRTKTIETVSKFIAFEGQMFVIASSSRLGQKELDFYLELDPSIEGKLDIGGGISGIISPYGEFVSEPIIDEEGIVYGDVDFDQILDAKHLIDSVGHYARNDVAKLILNKNMNKEIEYVENEFNEILLSDQNDKEN